MLQILFAYDKYTCGIILCSLLFSIFIEVKKLLYANLTVFRNRGSGARLFYIAGKNEYYIARAAKFSLYYH